MLAWEKSVFGYPAKYVHFPEVVVQFASRKKSVRLGTRLANLHCNLLSSSENRVA